LIYVFGADPFQNSPSSKTLLKELLKVGWKKSELKYAATTEDIADDSYVLCFGAAAFKTLTGCEEPLSKHAGSLFGFKNCLVFPTYSPGYLFHNPKLIGQFKNELETSRALIKFDQGESV